MPMMPPMPPSGGDMPAMPQGGSPMALGAPPSEMGAPPADGAPSGPTAEDGEPDFDTAMADLVTHASQDLDESDIKVLSKSMTPDVSWVLSKIFGVPAVHALQGLGKGPALGAPNGPTGPTSMMGK